MTNYEKIGLLVIFILIVAGVGLSYHEWSETKKIEQFEGPSFGQSVGPDLKLGSFDTVLSRTSSGPINAHCTALQPVIISTLHDVNQKLINMGAYQSGSFQVNQRSLDLLCHQTASITLSNSAGEKLILTKQPSTRIAPPGASPDNVGTSIHIDATIVRPGALPPTTRTTYGEEVIPDRYLGIQ